MNGHFRETNSSKKKNNYFHNAINKYGRNNFIFEEIDIANTIQELNEKEIYWIDYYDSRNKDIGYNLDSGGKNCTKSVTTKVKIGELKRLNWEDKDLATRMKMGLIKATAQWQQISKENRITLVCENCNKEFLLPKWLSKDRRFCSNKCFHEFSKSSKSYMIGLNKANELNKLSQTNKDLILKEFILKWINNNKDLVLKCPYNKLTNLQKLFDLIYDEFNIKDIRSITRPCCHSNSRKDLLSWMKSHC